MFPCPVCDVKLNSAEQRRAHCRGKNHIKREEARKKAEELGTDFDSTPDHCEVCNVPLTSKMTAIDHFKGKMHQKKVKAVEEQRQGFKNYCEICEVRLQSLKVSEAHFNGKQHYKRERKTNSCKPQGRNIPNRKPRPSRPRTEDFSPTQNIFDVTSKETATSSSSWESLICDNDSEAQDPLSEFRTLLRVKSLGSPDTSNSSSPESATEPFFSFGNAVLSAPSNHAVVHETTIPGRRLPAVDAILPPPNDLAPFFDHKDFPQVAKNATLDGLWESQGNFQHINGTFSPALPLPNTDSMSGQSKHLVQTQAVIRVLKEAGHGISSGEIATKIAKLSPSDVNVILDDLEEHHFVSKSGYAPILWSLAGTTDRIPSSPSKSPVKTLNGFPQPRKISIACPKEPNFFEMSKDSCYNSNGQKHPPTSEVCTALTAAILASCSRSTTTMAPSECDRTHTDVLESNLVNMFQKRVSLTVHEIRSKLDIRDETTLGYILHKLLERNIIVKDGEQRWRLASTPRNNVGVIGEERKRRSPLHSEGESSRDKTPTPPKDNNHPIPNVYHNTSTSPTRNGFFTPSSPAKETGYRVSNGFHPSPKEDCTRLQNGFHGFETFLPKNGYTEPEKRNGFWHGVNNGGLNSKVGHNSNSANNNKPQNRSSPPLKTETSEILEDLTVTAPTAYQKELYKMAMQEDTVCYLPCGTGKEIVIAQVIAHMEILNPTKQALVIVPDIVSALDLTQVLRKELSSKSKRKKLNVALHAGQLKQSTGKVQATVITSSTCLALLNCGALSWKEVCLLIFHNAVMCVNDPPSRKILHDYYLKSKMNFAGSHVPKLLSFLESSAGRDNLEETVRTFGNVLSSMGDVFLSCVSESVDELKEDKQEAMFVCVQTSLSENESRMFVFLGTYLTLAFDNLAAQWQPLNSYKELLKISFKESSVISEAFVKLIHLTGQPLEKRLPQSCLKTWRHYLAICEIIFALVECGEDLAKELLASLSREQFGFGWANDVGLPGSELSRQLMEKEIPNWDSSLSNPRGSGLRELLEQLMIIQWENARVSSERPLALVIVKVNKVAKVLANYLARCPQLVKRNVKTTSLDGTRSHQQKAVISAIKRRQYQVIVSTDNIDEDLPHCELVVLMDQPSSMYALEQLRTRRATNVVAICRDDDGEDKLKELLRREELVENAISCIRAGTT